MKPRQMAGIWATARSELGAILRWPFPVALFDVVLGYAPPFPRLCTASRVELPLEFRNVLNVFCDPATGCAYVLAHTRKSVSVIAQRPGRDEWETCIVWQASRPHLLACQNGVLALQDTTHVWWFQENGGPTGPWSHVETRDDPRYSVVVGFGENLRALFTEHGSIDLHEALGHLSLRTVCSNVSAKRCGALAFDSGIGRLFVLALDVDDKLCVLAVGPFGKTMLEPCRIWVIDTVIATFWTDAVALAVDSARGILYVGFDSTVCLVCTTTLELRATWSLPTQAHLGVVWGLAVRSDGSVLVAMSSKDADALLACVPAHPTF